MNRCSILSFNTRSGLIVCVLLAAMLSTAARAASWPAQPNIIVIMVDDLDVGLTQRVLDLGAMPNLKANIIDPGFTFSNAFVSNSVCCPSRATFLTGQYTHNHGVLTNYPPAGGVPAFDDSSTIATWLNDSGYYTGYIGKYLNGYGQFDLTGDDQVTIEDQTYIPPGWDEWRGLIDPGTYRMYDYSVNNNAVIENFGSTESDYQTDVLSVYVQDFLSASEQSDETPFFLTVMPLAPHVEIFRGGLPSDYHDIWKWNIRPAPRHVGTLPILLPKPPSYNEVDMHDKPLWLQRHEQLNSTDEQFLISQHRHRAEALRAVDDLVDALFNFLVANAELDHTIVIFTSDNGFMHGEHRLSDKSNAFEEAIRVPLYIRLPGAVQNVSIDQLVLNNDLAPTIAELAGAAVGHIVDGRSITGLLEVPAPDAWRRQFLIEHYAGGFTPLYIPNYSAIRSGSYWNAGGSLTLVRYDDPNQTNEYYDLGFDPYQQYSLHDAPLRQGEINLLNQFADLLEQCKGADCRALEDYNISGYSRGSLPVTLY